MRERATEGEERRAGRTRTVLFALIGLAVLTAAVGGVLLSVRGTGSFDATTRNHQDTETASGKVPSESKSPAAREEPARPKP